MNDAPIPLPKETVVALESPEICAFESLVHAAPPEQAAHHGISAMRLGSALLATAAAFDMPIFNRVIGLGLDEPIAPKQIDSIMQEYVRRRVPRYFIQLQPLADTPETRALLVARGFVPYNNWVRFSRDLAPIAGVKCALRVEAIGAEKAEAFARIVSTCYGHPESTRPWMQSCVGQAGWHHYLALNGEAPVAAAALFVAGRDAWMGFAATLPEYQGCGAQAALVQHRIEDARAAGCVQVVLETAQPTAERPAPSHRNMLRYGFAERYVRPNYLYRNV